MGEGGRGRRKKDPACAVLATVARGIPGGGMDRGETFEAASVMRLVGFVVYEIIDQFLRLNSVPSVEFSTRR